MSQSTLRIVDPRLLAPHSVRRIALLGRLDDSRKALGELGIAIVDEGADLVVADAAHAEAAARVALLPSSSSLRDGAS